MTAWQEPVSDVSDARVCAFIAREFVVSPENLEAPVPSGASVGRVDLGTDTSRLT